MWKNHDLSIKETSMWSREKADGKAMEVLWLLETCRLSEGKFMCIFTSGVLE
jgi:hypothetical protein